MYHCPLPPPISSSLKLSLRLFLYHKSSHRAQVYDLSHYLTNKLPLDTSPHYHSLCHTRTARSSRSSGGGDYMLSEIAQNRSVIVAASRAENTSQISSNRRPVRHGNRRHLLPLGSAFGKTSERAGPNSIATQELQVQRRRHHFPPFVRVCFLPSTAATRSMWPVLRRSNGPC